MSSKEAMKISYGTLASKVELRIDQLRAANDMQILRKTLKGVKSARLHAYKGKEMGTFSLDITRTNVRLLFKAAHRKEEYIRDNEIIWHAITEVEITTIKGIHS